MPTVVHWSLDYAISGYGVAVGGGVALGVSVIVGVAVGVAVQSGVGEGVMLGVAVGLAVGDGDGVSVGSGVGVGVEDSTAKLQPESRTSNPMTTATLETSCFTIHTFQLTESRTRRL